MLSRTAARGQISRDSFLRDLGLGADCQFNRILEAAHRIGLPSNVRYGGASEAGNKQNLKGTKRGSSMSEVATFAAGCFWGVEAAFQRVEGVIATEVGFSNGHTPNPTYHDVCTDETGHAEVVRVTFDPAKISYEELLNVFW